MRLLDVNMLMSMTTFATYEETIKSNYFCYKSSSLWSEIFLCELWEEFPEWMDESLLELGLFWMGVLMGGWMEGLMGGWWTYKRLKRSMDGLVVGLLWMVGWVDGWIVGTVDDWMDGRVGGLMSGYRFFWRMKKKDIMNQHDESGMSPANNRWDLSQQLQMHTERHMKAT